MMADDGRRDRKRALFKKGQKCIVPILETDKESNEEKIVYYEAIIMRGEKRPPNPESTVAVYMYLIHYKGFGKSHDCWLEEKDLLKFDHDLLTGGTSVAADDARRRAREAADASRKKAALQEIPVQLRLRVPPLLKKIALDDHAQVTQRGLALQLPRPAHARPSVTAVLRDWREAQRAADAQPPEEGAEPRDAAAREEQRGEVEEGLRSYFGHALRQFLLYSPEVAACDEALAGGVAPSEVYGAEHLVRLLVKLPELVPVVMMAGQGDARNVVALEGHLHDFMAFLCQAQAKIFSSVDEYKPNPRWTPPLLVAALAGVTAAAAPPAAAPPPPQETAMVQ